MKDGVLVPGRTRYGVMHLTRPVLAGARLSVLYGVHCGNFGSIGLPVLFRMSRNYRKLGATLSQLYVRTRRSITSNIGCVVLDSGSISRARTPVPSLLTIDTIRRRLVSTRGHIRATLIIRAKRVHRIVRTTLLLNCKTDTVGPCVSFTVLRSLISERRVRLGCRVTHGGCVGTLYGNLFGIVDGVKVDAVHDCQNTGLFRTINLSATLASTCFKKATDDMNNVHLRRVTTSTVTLRRRTFEKAVSDLALRRGKLCDFHGSNRGRT